MAVTSAETHFVQDCDGPVFVGFGGDAFACGCGNLLIQRFDPQRFLGVAIQCRQCGAVNTTPALPPGQNPPAAVVIAEPVAERRTATMELPETAFIVGRAEMDRIGALYSPVTPASSTYKFTPALLDTAAAAFQRHTGQDLPSIAIDPAQPFDGLKQHALGWAVAYLQSRMAAGAWSNQEAPATSNACCHVAGFLHFVATWSHHPLFPLMAATANDRGCNLHGLAPFAAAHVLTAQGNRTGFRAEAGRIAGIVLASGPAGGAQVRTDVFDRFEFPFGLAWSEAALKLAVREQIEITPAYINLRNPGLLLLSPGTALQGFDEALIRAVQAVLPETGRKNRGLAGVAPIVLRILPDREPDAVRFGYGLFPVRNRHYRGDIALG